MKIDAVRVAAFKRFAEPAALEVFAAGLNVFAGPNEFGKSTFFSALEAAFLTRHKVSGAALIEMRPYSGGEPLVEVDFSRDGVRWRIRKQFGRGNTAVLTNLDTGRVAARNAEAEEQLARLIGKPDDIPGPLGLVWVPQKRMIVAPDLDTDMKGKDKQRGELSALQTAISQEVEAAASGEDFQHVQQLTAKALDQLLTPARNSARKNGPLDLARRARDETRIELQKAQDSAANAEQRLQRISDLNRQLSDVVDPARAAARRRDLETREAQHQAELKRRSEFELAHESLTARTLEVTAAQREIADVDRRAKQVAALDAQHQLAMALEADIARLSASLNDDAATRPRIEQLSALVRDQDVADAALAADPARIELDLESSAAARVQIDGTPVSGRVSRDVHEAVDITIDGIGRIRVLAAGAEAIASARAAKSAAQERIGEILAVIGVSSLAEARQRYEARAANVEALDRARGKLSGVAPNGAAELEAERAQLATDRQAAAPSDSKLQSLEAAALAARERFDGLKAAMRSDADFNASVAALEAARSHEASSQDTIQRLTQQIENLKSEQAGAGEDGLAGDVDRLTGLLERQDQDVKRLESEGRALLLLAGTLAKIESNARDAFFSPVLRRIEPHISAVFGAGTVGFEDAFAISGLTRNSQHEAFKALSDGTQEQLSVLVRVAFAELLAERGVPVPLVLDDPLVYSDDERLARVCSVLEKAAEHVQVIVLTCRATAFQKLTGHRVSLTAWRPEM